MYRRNLSAQLWKEKIYTIFQKQRRDFKIKNKDKKYSIIILFFCKDEAKNGRNQGNIRGLKLPYSFHFFYSWPRLCTEELTVTNIKIAIKTSIASSRYWKSVDQTKDVLNNLSQFRFLYYNSGNIPLHLELI